MPGGNVVIPFELKLFVQIQTSQAFPIIYRKKFVSLAETVHHVRTTHPFPTLPHLSTYLRSVPEPTSGVRQRLRVIFLPLNTRLQLEAQVQSF